MNYQQKKVVDSRTILNSELSTRVDSRTIMQLVNYQPDSELSTKEVDSRTIMQLVNYQQRKLILVLLC